MYNFMSYIDNNLVRSKTVLQENLPWASEVQAISRTSPNIRYKEDALMISDLKLISSFDNVLFQLSETIRVCTTYLNAFGRDAR